MSVPLLEVMERPNAYFPPWALVSDAWTRVPPGRCGTNLYGLDDCPLPTWSSVSLFPRHKCHGHVWAWHGHALTYNEKWTWLYFIFRGILGRSTLPLSLLFSFMGFLTLSAPCSFAPRCLFSLAGSCYVVQQSFKLAIPSLQSPAYSDCWCTVHHTVAGLSEGFCCCHCVLLF